MTFSEKGVKYLKLYRDLGLIHLDLISQMLCF